MSELKKYVITKTYKTQKTWFIYAKDEPNAIESINEDKPNMTQERNTSCNIEEDDSMLEDDLFFWLDRKYKKSNTETKWKLCRKRKEDL